jgi:3-deoxy-manno-octulosonate cytidylyltransferase (CMP-KDO synthetase)
MTGTDRVAEVARKLRTPTILNVQGDEPMVSPEDIERIAEVHLANPSLVVNGYVPLSPEEDPARTTIPKVVLDQQENLLYISRRDIPGSKAPEPGSDSTLYLKQVCIYGFSPEHLERYASYHQKTPLEEKEDIEILRFLEMGQLVKMVRTQTSSLAVDTPEDVVAVEEAMKGLGFTP